MRLFSVGIAILVGSACKTNPPPPAQGDAATALADGGKHGPVNELPIPKDVVDNAINPLLPDGGRLPEYKGPTGVVEGTVYVTGDPAPPVMGKNFDKCPAAEAFYSKAFREGPPLSDGSRVLADTILEVTGYYGFFIPEQRPSRVVTIANCTYSARNVDMTFGQALEVKNDNAGPLFAPYLVNQPATAVLLATPGGDPVRLYPKTPGRYRLADRVGNTWLDAEVFVAVTPLHTVTDAVGHYRIEGVPPGKMTLHAWHPAIAHSVTKDVDVRDGVVATVDVSIANDKAATMPSARVPKPLLK
jgi:hypothetical protein